MERDVSNSRKLRQIITNQILRDPVKYNDAVLGQKTDAYCKWILKQNNWGGAIELGIFSSHFGVEIDSIDIQSGRIDKFGEGQYTERVFVLYSGIHAGFASSLCNPCCCRLRRNCALAYSGRTTGFRSDKIRCHG
ncbi:hypothetical protein BC936DRAFT_142420 [Jimgerdemannia flammicorona]|uniref:Ubiquitin thioesterase OTU n=1 Tax=Jimgerdemannia flammicorona TaxID=994334 RepID=A0A433A0F8_9FUNG|nr:hypothetical protein BC936DRAFT_142420 [Jimgerdemannia flammicorona]